MDHDGIPTLVSFHLFLKVTSGYFSVQTAHSQTLVPLVESGSAKTWQDAVTKANVSRQLNTLVDMKQEMRVQKFRSLEQTDALLPLHSYSHFDELAGDYPAFVRTGADPQIQWMSEMSGQPNGLLVRAEIPKTS